MKNEEGDSSFPGWRELVALANRSGEVTVWDGAVYEGDDYHVRLGSEPVIRHNPGPNFGDEDRIIATYACALPNGGGVPIVEFCTVEQIKNHRDRYNELGEEHYSFTYFEAYARKMPLLRVLKRVLDRSDWERVAAAEWPDAGRSNEELKVKNEEGDGSPDDEPLPDPFDDVPGDGAVESVGGFLAKGGTPDLF